MRGPRRPEIVQITAAAMSASAGITVSKTIVLVGLMGAGKSSIGRRLAQRLGLAFVDADHEIEQAAGCSIDDIFQRLGEAYFRDGERRVIARLLDRPPHVLATGGGAFMDGQTRASIAAKGISVWLRADLDLLLDRVSRRNNRPLLKKGEPREILERLINERYPVYALADICVESGSGPADETVDRVIAALMPRLAEPASEADSIPRVATGP
jgi:shikimate kinase